LEFTFRALVAAFRQRIFSSAREFQLWPRTLWLLEPLIDLGDDKMNKAKKKISSTHNSGSLIREEELCKCDLRGRIELMSEAAQRLVMKGHDAFMICAIVTGPEAWFLMGKLIDDRAKWEMQDKVIELAMQRNADCLLTVAPAWMATGSNAERPSQNLNRKEVLAVAGKDNHEHLAGFQEIRRSRGRISFGELEVYPGSKSWLDEYPFLNAAQAYC
jgi:hypothetical protein